ncbi:MAG: hypothetical protein RLZZ152_1177, partial [Pseudomonadota bacterium]
MLQCYIPFQMRYHCDGDIATPESARDHVKAILSADRYDFSRVGRFHFNRRFGLSTADK